MSPYNGTQLWPDYETVAASQDSQILGATGGHHDVLLRLIIVPATTSPGNVLLEDGDGSEVTVFTGGADSIAYLHPMVVEVGARCTAATTPGWKVTTGANVSVVGVGYFT